MYQFRYKPIRGLNSLKTKKDFMSKAGKTTDCLTFNIIWPPGAYHRLCSYTTCTERGGRVNPPHIHLSPGPLPGLYCELGDTEKNKTKQKTFNIT